MKCLRSAILSDEKALKGPAKFYPVSRTVIGCAFLDAESGRCTHCQEMQQTCIP
jgi:hypothetical protein